MVLVFTELAICYDKKRKNPTKETTYIYTENSRSVNLVQKEKSVGKEKTYKRKNQRFNLLVLFILAQVIEL